MSQSWTLRTFPVRTIGGLKAPVRAYAATIHKSQGSGYPAVVMPVRTQDYAMLHRNLIYTGITRSKKLVVLGGPEERGRRGRAKRVRAQAVVEAPRVVAACAT